MAAISEYVRVEYHASALYGKLRRELHRSWVNRKLPHHANMEECWDGGLPIIESVIIQAASLSWSYISQGKEIKIKNRGKKRK
jgi:hypothetical protein